MLTASPFGKPSLWETIVEEWVILAGLGSWSLGWQRAHMGQT